MHVYISLSDLGQKLSSDRLCVVYVLQYTRALLVLTECHRLKARNPVVPLQAAKLCYEYLHLVSMNLHT